MSQDAVDKMFHILTTFCEQICPFFAPNLRRSAWLFKALNLNGGSRDLGAAWPWTPWTMPSPAERAVAPVVS